MSYKPFLSHKRERQNVVQLLKNELLVRGAGAWKDTDDLTLGKPFHTGLVDAIERETSGFIWWGTRDTLSSEVICNTELPTALDRAKRDPAYPFVPVFVDLIPGRDATDIEAALGKRCCAQLLDANGIVCGRRESHKALVRRVARQYVRQMVEGLAPGPVSVAVTAFRAPTEHHEITLDWRPLFDANTRQLADGAIGAFGGALADLRDAFQTRESSPEVLVDVDLPLPLALLVGHEWRVPTQLRVTVETVQAAGPPLVVAPQPAADRVWPVAHTDQLSGNGAYVMAVSVDRTLGEAVRRYAADHDASGFEHLHVPGRLDADGVRDLAAHVAGRLSTLHAKGTPKHLLLQGPAALAAASGLAANGTGRTWVPFWDGHDGYVGGLTIG